jgi:hypothetical protein
LRRETLRIELHLPFTMRSLALSLVLSLMPASAFIACGGEGATVEDYQDGDPFSIHTSTVVTYETVPCSQCRRYGEYQDVCRERCVPDEIPFILVPTATGEGK